MTENLLVLRLAERFGVGDPVAWWEGKSHGERALLLGYELLRQHEETSAGFPAR